MIFVIIECVELINCAKLIKFIIKMNNLFKNSQLNKSDSGKSLSYNTGLVGK